MVGRRSWEGHDERGRSFSGGSIEYVKGWGERAAQARCAGPRLVAMAGDGWRDGRHYGRRQRGRRRRRKRVKGRQQRAAADRARVRYGGENCSKRRVSVRHNNGRGEGEGGGNGKRTVKSRRDLYAPRVFPCWTGPSYAMKRRERRRTFRPTSARAPTPRLRINMAALRVCRGRVEVRATVQRCTGAGAYREPAAATMMRADVLTAHCARSLAVS